MSYDSNVLALNPKHFWKMDETSGTVCTDYGTTPVNGVYNGSPSLNQAPLSCPSGSGTISSDATMNLDGSDDSMTVATNPSYTAITVCGWFKALTTVDQYWFEFGYSGGHIPIAIGGGNGGFGTSSKWNVGVFNGGWNVVSGSPIISGDEKFIVATMSSSGSLRMWENGRFKGSVALGSVSAYSSGLGLRIGRRWDGSNFSTGRVSGIAMWDSVLSDSDILSLVPPEEYFESEMHLEPDAAPNATPWRAYGEGSVGGGGGGGTPPTIGQLWPRGNW